MNKVLKFGFLFGLLGYAIAVLMQILAVRFLVSPAVIRVFVPITNLTMMFPVNISWTSVLILIGPINAIVYFLLGTLVGAVYTRFRAAMSGGRTAPLKPTPGLNGPPESRE